MAKCGLSMFAGKVHVLAWSTWGFSHAIFFIQCLNLSLTMQASASAKPPPVSVRVPHGILECIVSQSIKVPVGSNVHTQRCHDLSFRRLWFNEQIMQDQ